MKTFVVDNARNKAGLREELLKVSDPAICLLDTYTGTPVATKKVTVVILRTNNQGLVFVCARMQEYTEECQTPGQRC